jgi:signal transduction histidine kinase
MNAVSDTIQQAYVRYTTASNVRNSKVACVLVVILMPMGYVLDHHVYPSFEGLFFELRLACSALAAVLLVVLHQPGFSDRIYRVLCMGWYLIPAFFISWMIGVSGGFNSTYYAGLNLVILAINAVIQASLVESLIAVLLILSMYLTASFLNTPKTDWRMFVNNGYFMFCTAVIVMTGNFFYNRLRFREFALRYELDKNRKELEATNQKLTELDQIKSRFFANISHELRTPLTLMLSPLETLIHRFAHRFDEETQGVLLTMHGNGLRLLRLINDLLDLVRLDSGVMQVKREPVFIEDFLRGLVSAARQLAEDKRIRLQSHVTNEVGTVLVDRDKLEKIILNLQFNALKFTSAGGRVDVRARKQDDELVIEVVDTGVGISEKNLPNVFNRFWQADSSSKRKFQGVGIGLALAKELVEIQGGKVGVQSKENIGTTFTVHLPLLRPEPGIEAVPRAAEHYGKPSIPGNAADSPEPHGTVSNEEWLANLYRRAELFPSISLSQQTVKSDENVLNGDRPRVLVADDEPDMLRFLKSQLSTHYQVIETTDGQQAFAKAVESQPDIALLDMMMPEKDGLQVCRELREHVATKSLPIILLTARADEETKFAALSAGASDFLPKPFSTTELHVRVKNLIESYDFQRRLSRKNAQLEQTIQQLKDTESQLVQTEKLASLGRLSAGIIHEINNPLNFATTGLFTLRSKARLLAAEQQSDYNEILKDVEDGISRVKAIVSDLHSFTHPGGSLALDSIPVSDAVISALRFVAQESKERIIIQTNLADRQTVWANKNKLIQVLINLLENSLDAVHRKQFKDGRPAIVITGRVEGNKSLLIVRDNGIGIDPQHLDKVFDPFFTTKDVGEGMGLGLSICYRIMKESQGQISVRSEPGEFSEFTLEFLANAPESLVQP